MNVAVGGELERSGGVPVDRSVDVYVPRLAALGHGLQGDVAALQVGGKRVGTDAAVGLGRAARADDEVGGIDEPVAGSAIDGQGGDLQAFVNLHMSTGGVDEAAITTLGCAGVKL